MTDGNFIRKSISSRKFDVAVIMVIGILLERVFRVLLERVFKAYFA